MNVEIFPGASPVEALDNLAGPKEIITAMRDAILQRQEHWFLAVLPAIAHWRLPEETLNGRHFRYLICGEAFDWLSLAERLCLELEELAPLEEREALLFNSAFPVELSEEEFRRLLGPAKYRAHLNFVYGVLVEEALQLAVEQELEKERQSSLRGNGHQDDDAFLRLYGAAQGELLQRFAVEHKLPINGSLTLLELREFTYWLFKHRLQRSDPARIASDTRRGLSVLARLRASRPGPRP